MLPLPSDTGPLFYWDMGTRNILAVVLRSFSRESLNFSLMASSVPPPAVSFQNHLLKALLSGVSAPGREIAASK